MSLHLSVFDFGALAIRARVCADSGVLFAAVDVCNALELCNSRMAMQGLDDDEKITVTNGDGNPREGRPHSLTWVTESGLYHLIFKSRKPAARKFRRWVTEVVLPQLRQRGRFDVGHQEVPGGGMVGVAGRMLSFPAWVAELAPEGLEPHFERELAGCVHEVSREAFWRARGEADSAGFSLIPEWIWRRATRRWLVGPTGKALRCDQLLALAEGRGVDLAAGQPADEAETDSKEVPS